jgi:hypothetical protein
MSDAEAFRPYSLVKSSNPHRRRSTTASFLQGRLLIQAGIQWVKVVSLYGGLSDNLLGRG